MMCAKSGDRAWSVKRGGRERKQTQGPEDAARDPFEMGLKPPDTTTTTTPPLLLPLAPVREPAASPGPVFLRAAEEHMSPIRVLLSQHAIKAERWAPSPGPSSGTPPPPNTTHSALERLFSRALGRVPRIS